jgi:hypothetical protein
MHTVAQTHAFTRAAEDAGMTEEEISELASYLSENPTAGDVIVGTGGCRKLRWAGRGKGKSGGYRTITFYSGDAMPVFLITVFSKGERSNLSKSECNYLGELTKKIAVEYRAKVAKVAKGRT